MFQEHIGELVQQTTAEVYAPKVRDWYAYNDQAGYDARDVCDSKVMAFAGWLGWRRGAKNSRDKCLNAWTSALNGHFDASWGLRPFNTHAVTALKKRYRDAQLTRTMAMLPADALEPKEARIGLPASGITTLLWQMVAARGAELYRLLLQIGTMLFLPRPATLWALEGGDYCLVMAPGRLFIVFVSRSVKRHPEYVVNPNRREIEVPRNAECVLAQVAYALYRAQREDPDWCTQLRRECTLQKHAAARVSKWLRAAVSQASIALPAGRRLSSYSLRIAGVSAMVVALRVDLDFVRRWGLWTTVQMVYIYRQEDYGRSDILGQLFGWACVPEHGGQLSSSATLGGGGGRGGLLAGDTTAPRVAPAAPVPSLGNRVRAA